MLVISRKMNESFTVGADVRITIVRVKGDQVRIGIEAPAEVAVIRDDCVDRGPAAARVDAVAVQPEPVAELAQ